MSDSDVLSNDIDDFLDSRIDSDTGSDTGSNTGSNTGQDTTSNSKKTPSKIDGKPLSKTAPQYLSFNDEEMSAYLQSFGLIQKGSTSIACKIFLALWAKKQEVMAWSSAINIAQQTVGIPEETVRNIIEDKICPLELMIIHITHFAEKKTFEYIRFCEPNSNVFYCEYITKQLSTASISLNVPLTLYIELKKKHINIPDEFIIPYDKDKSYLYTLRPNIYAPEIFCIDLYKNMFYFTNLSTPLLIDTIIIRFNNLLAFAGAELFFQLNSILAIDKTDFQASINNRKITQLFIFIEKIFENLDLLKNNIIINKYPEFLDFTLLLYHILPMYITYGNSKTLQKENIKNYTNTLLAIIQRDQVFSKYPFEILVTNTLKEVYSNENREIIHEQKILFLKKHVISVNEVKTLNVDLLIDFQEYYILSRTIKSILINQYSKIKTEIQHYLKKELQNILLGKVAYNNSVFSNTSKTEECITQYLFKHYPEYYTITKHPNIIFLALKRNDDDNSTADITPIQLLSLFMNVETKRIFKWVNILNIALKTLYSDTTRSLNFIQKLFVAIRGTKKTFLKQLEEYNSRRNM